ncbi:MAG TPA: questin oxidase family protein [Acidimicrobiales bacterium]|jgi:hypothetical protein
MEEVTGAELGQMIDEDLDLDATTAEGLTNHLPMALVAKAGLGAPAKELKRFARRYRRRLAPTNRATVTLTSASWRRAVGEREAYPDLVEYFDQSIATEGIEQTLRRHLDALVDGISGAAFHGVIRLAYALDVASPARVATGLAYLSSSATVLGSLEAGPAQSNDAGEIMRRLASETGPIDEPVRTIDARMRLVAQRPEFAHVAGALEINDNTFQQLNAVALRLYARTDDFTALHGVTGMEAIGKIRPYVSDRARLDRAAFQALAAAYLTIGAPDFWSGDWPNSMVEVTALDAEEVAARAALSNDEHVAKIVFTSLRMSRDSPDDLYLAVAERAVHEDRTNSSSEMSASSDAPRCE